ncbi:uncharacterized protein LOC143125309 isoform X2 [Alosa pseudoharengus]|uniref:uncharacterized protein LOC143125309 isoform X2 n=1 Tax=Alosa pseudoharengus TaxID=34774 RepID=UPI003F88A94A
MTEWSVMTEGSLPIETDEAHTSSVKAPPKRKEESTTCRPWQVSFETARGCNICGQSQKDPVRILCGHVFCRQCILLHLETQSATGEYTCPSCRRRYSTRPALQPYSTTQKQLQKKKQYQHGYLPWLLTEKDDGFLKFHKASLKRRVEQCDESITKAACQTNHRIIRNDTIEDGAWFPSRLEMDEKKLTSVCCNDIFKAFNVRRQNRGQENIIRTLMTQGAAGIGKTSSVHKFILDWADGKENQDVDFVFMFPFWKLNLVKDICCSLHKLLLNFHPELDNIAETDIKRFDDSKIVVIFDGLDESQLHLDFQSDPMLCDILEISSVDTLITNVIKGNLLPFAKVWITSRGSSTNQVPSWYINRVTEILPLSDSQMEECVKDSLKDVTDASCILHQIKLSRSLYAMCHIPALCSIAVSVVKNMLEQGESRMIQTCTELYSHFFISQMNTEAEAKSSSVQDEGEKMVDEKPQRTKMEMMMRFSELALRQLMKNSFTFSEQDLRDCEIDISETASIFRIFTEIHQDKSEFFQENVFHLKHMGIQEFLAAFCVFYAYINKNMDVLKHLLGGKFRIQPEDVSLDTLLRRAVDKMLERKNGHQYFLRFLHGMSLESSQTLLQCLLTDYDSSGTTESTLKYIKDLGKQADVSMDRCIDLLHCQIEMQDPSVIEDIESLLKSQREFSLSHWSEISTLIQMSGGILGEFNHQKCHPSERKTVLSMFVSCCRKAQISNCDLSADSCVMVASALQQPHSALRELDMSGNNLGTSGVEQLCSGLKSPNCKLEILRLSNCDLSADSFVMVASALQQPHSALRELDMSGNILWDFGVKQLCSGLKSPNCKLEILRVSNCGLSVDYCVMVASALQQPHSALRELDMSGNNLWDSGVKQLCFGLKSPNCKLEILRLSNCDLSADSFVMVASALQQPHSALRELDMSGNLLWDFGVKQLCSGLKSPNCKLEILRVSNCGLSVDYCVMVASALQQPHSALRELDMSRNNLWYSGVKQLCFGLKSPNCKLEILRLSNCDLSAHSCVMVASALQQPHSALRELDMSGNNLRDSGVEQLCSGLKSPNCKLEILRLSQCKLGNTSCWKLNSALGSDHSRLRELDVSNNFLEESEVKLLTKRVEDPKCKLEVLKPEPTQESYPSSLEPIFPLLEYSSPYHDSLPIWPEPTQESYPSSLEPIFPLLEYSSPYHDSLPIWKSPSRCVSQDSDEIIAGLFNLKKNDDVDADTSSLKECIRDDDNDDDDDDGKSSHTGFAGESSFSPPTQVDTSSIMEGDLVGVSSSPKKESENLKSHKSSGPFKLKTNDYDEDGGDGDGDDNDDDGDGKSRAKTEVSLSSEEESECLEPQESDGPFKLQTNDCDEDGGGGDDDDNDEDDGKSSAETECSGGVSADKEFENISDSCAVPEVFTPECCPYNERRSYRFTCSSEGLFQCWYTGLVFKMETAGEVKYRTEPWNCVQLVDDYVPAGPLFDIKCPQGSLSQLHFPHCELFSGKGCLSVIHISDSEESEMLDPHEITDIHVVLNISGCSEYGLIKKEYTPIHGLVLLFLQQSTLNVLLLPKNVDISEVTEKRRERIEPEKEKYVETTSNCILVPEEKYCLTCDPKHVIDPETATFVDYDYNKNYIPTFQVELCECVKVMMVLKENDKEEPVWQRTVKLAALQTERNQRDLPDSNPSSSYTPTGQKFFQKHKADLERRLPILGNLLAQLEKRKALTGEERELLNSKPTRQEKNHVLLTMLQNRGGKAQEIFYQTLKKLDPLLVEDLEKPNESEAESESEFTEQVQ